MSDLPFLFAVAVLVAAGLATIAVWAPRGLPTKLAAVLGAAAFMPLGYAGFADLLSRPKPVGLEWWLAAAPEATVLGSQMSEGQGLYLWLQLAGEQEPRAYRMPWDQALAQQLQAAQDEAARQGGGAQVRMRLPFEPTLDRREPLFYAPPQEALPPKDLARPPAQVYVQPGQDA